MIRIHGLMVVKNEADRYLQSCLNWMTPYLDSLFIYDDQSEDKTLDVIFSSSLTCHTSVIKRAKDIPSFLEHEGRFRQSAWDTFTSAMPLAYGDWILAFDADEFMVLAPNHANTDARLAMEKLVKRATQKKCNSIILPFLEVFKYSDNEFFYRTDGLWPTVRGTRLFQFEPNGTWKDKPMGCGSEPSYVTFQKAYQNNNSLYMLHMGYAKDEDKQIKYDRYTALADHGHNDSHIQSIIAKPKLEIWNGEKPNVWSGVK